MKSAIKDSRFRSRAQFNLFINRNSLPKNYNDKIASGDSDVLCLMVMFFLVCVCVCEKERRERV